MISAIDRRSYQSMTTVASDAVYADVILGVRSGIALSSFLAVPARPSRAVDFRVPVEKSDTTLSNEPRAKVTEKRRTAYNTCILPNKEFLGTEKDYFSLALECWAASLLPGFCISTRSGLVC